MVCDFFTLRDANGSSFLPEIRVVMLGDAKVGKTAFLRQYLHRGSPSLLASTDSTLLDTYTHVEYCGMQPYRLIFTDCSSAPSFREHRAAYLAKCDVVILVYSVRHRKTLLNLRHWVGEVMEARSSMWPASSDSVTGDFDRVHIFVVGTHYGEKDTSEATVPTSTVEAESITKECLQSAGYLIDDEEADTKEELHPTVAETQKTQQHLQRQEAKKKRFPGAFNVFFHKLFLNGSEGEGIHASAKKKGTSGEVVAHQCHQPASSVHDNRSLLPTTSAPMLPHLKADVASESTKSSGTMSVLSIPPGASARLPLFQLSNTDGEAVHMALRASLSLHLWLQRQECKDAALSAVHAPCSSSTTDSKSANAVVQSAPLQANRNGAGDTAAAATESTAELSRMLSAAQHAGAISNAPRRLHLSERSRESFMPQMLALYSAGLNTSIGGGWAESLGFRNSLGVSYVRQMTVNSSSTEQQASQVPGTTQPPYESVCLDCADGGIEVTIGDENEVKAVDEEACHGTCSRALARRVNGPEDGSLWRSPATCSPHGDVEKEVLTNWGSPQTALSRGTELASSELGGALASAASTQVRIPMPKNMSSYFPPANPPWGTAPNAGFRETSRDVSNAVELSTTYMLRGAADTVGGELSASSGHLAQEHPSLLSVAPSTATVPRRKDVAGVVVGAGFLPPASRTRKGVDAAKEDIAGSDSCGGRPIGRKAPMGRKLSLKHMLNRGLSSSLMPRCNRDDDCAGSSAVHSSSTDTGASLGRTANVHGSASLPAGLSPGSGSVLSEKSPQVSTATTTAVTNTEITSTKSLQQSARARRAVTLPLPPSSKTAARKQEKSQLDPFLPPQGGKERPTHSSAFKQSGTPVASPRTLARQPPPKESLAQCNAGGCTAM